MQETKPNITSVLGYFGLLFVAMGLCIFFISLLGMYYAFFDIGINASANSFGLVFFKMPLTFVFFLVVGWATYYRLQKHNWRAWRSFAVSICVMGVAVLLAFLVDVLRLVDYPKYPGRNFTDFLGYVWEEWRAFLIGDVGFLGEFR